MLHLLEMFLFLKPAYAIDIVECQSHVFSCVAIIYYDTVYGILPLQVHLDP